MSVDVSAVKKDLEDLLDKSIQAGEYVIPHHKRIKDLSALDANALHDFFVKLENKNMQLESLSAELEQKISEMVKRNKKRARFMERLNSLLHEYNTGAHDIDELFEQLVQLAKDLTEEEQRVIKENLSEEELAIFDLLLNENLNPDEIEKVRYTARELLSKLKAERLVLDWREKEQTRSGVRTTIVDVLYDSLPEPTYTQQDCDYRGSEVYNFVYEHYLDANNVIYS